MTENFKSPTDAIIKNVLEVIKFDDRGLVPAIAQDDESGKVLMMAWMNSEAIKETLKTGMACYYSRSRSKLWRKGEESGQTQTIKDFRVDCDGDTVLIVVKQKGVACHTGRHSCFFKSINDDGIHIIEEVLINPDSLYQK
tara:strand:+ start:199 stop:618 length:420 start_codon:yes stop_codon:yes gene_type:complete